MTLPHGFTPCEECREKLRVAVRMERQRKAARKAPGVATKARAQMERLGRLTVIRAKLLAETGSKCAVCGGAITLDTMEAHHLVGGGLRRARERAGTMAPLCYGCHQGDGHNSAGTVEALLMWCRRTGRTEAAQALNYRLTKIEEARR